MAYKISRLRNDEKDMIYKFVNMCTVPKVAEAFVLVTVPFKGFVGYSHTLPIRVCAAQQGRDFEAPDLERGIHLRGVF